ncbi:MAG: helix-turn-helix domain-containing protein [Clostridia bacterium]|nr:helix-turn-helix domain-containing protein [Clostridia bacterium]
MKILYKQPETAVPSPYDTLGIRQCYLKQFSMEKDDRNITKKAHHHTSFEIHIIISGCQTYEVGQQQYRVESGQFFMIPPLCRHRVVGAEPHTGRWTITFEAIPESGAMHLESLTECALVHTPIPAAESLDWIREEEKRAGLLSEQLIENRLFETIVCLLRALGVKERKISREIHHEESRLTLVKQFVQDNICHPLTVTDIAEYCHLSEKQLTRLFVQHEEMTPQKYIQRQRIRHIEKLLSDPAYSLRQISEEMHFSSEYYFNAFFSRHSGMPPAAWRKMHRDDV